MKKQLKSLWMLAATLAMFTVSGVAAASADAEAAWQKALAAQSEGQSQAAIEAYESILRSDGGSAAVFFNLGNAYAQKNQRGLALLSYERARLLEPRDAAIAANLKTVRAQAGFPENAPWWQHAFELLSWNAWSIMAMAGLWVLAVAALAASMKKSFLPEAARNALAVAGVVLLAAGLAGSSVWFLERNRAIVIASEGVLRLSPFETAQPSGTLPEGAEAHIEKQFGAFYFARARDGQSGWIAARQIEPILP